KVAVPLSKASRAVMVMGSSYGLRIAGRRLAPAGHPSLPGRHPGFFSLHELRQLGAAFDSQLDVRAREVTLDGLERHEEPISDLAVGVAVGRKLHDMELPGAQGFQARAPLAPRACARGPEFLAHPICQRSRAAAGGEFERLRERLTRGGAAAIASKRCPE